MSDAAQLRILPMTTTGTQHLIERTYREGGDFQWVRETYKNSEEAGATRIEFGIEWQAVENLGVYRRVIADNGSGMTAEELVEFFNTFGGGGKPIGGVHENFGVGAKTSLLPWNRAGMVVISVKDGDPAMIWVEHDPESGEYGLRLQEVDDEEGQSLDEVYEPYNDDDYGCNWAAALPDWVDDHGTVVILLGNDGTDDTVVGDPNRQESDIKGISTYLNRRLWEIPDGVDVRVDELRTQDRKLWPREPDPTHGTNLRQIRGANFYITYPSSNFTKGKLKAAGTRTLSDATEIDWFLWEGERPSIGSYAAVGGYIAALYEGELYDVSTHQATYRSFGITEREVRSRTWLIVRPPNFSEENGKHGVYPRTDRNSLLLKGGPRAGTPLPLNDWAAEFADPMPAPLLDAIKKARTGEIGSLSDPKWRDRLADRFGNRWRIPRLRLRKGGALTVDPSQPGSRPKKVRRVKRHGSGGGGGQGGRSGSLNTGSRPGSRSATKVNAAGGLPNYHLVGADEVGPGMLASWVPNDPTEPNGVVKINVEHPVLMEEVEHWQAQYPDNLADEVRIEVLNTYGEIAVAKVAHSEHLKGSIPSKQIEDELRSEAALSMSLLGLMAEEAVIAPRIGGKFRKRAAA
ncbi:MAG: hypothetical protein AABM66_12470 [Actinomycetota bacterium]